MLETAPGYKAATPKSAPNGGTQEWRLRGEEKAASPNRKSSRRKEKKPRNRDVAKGKLRACKGQEACFAESGRPAPQAQQLRLGRGTWAHQGSCGGTGGPPHLCSQGVHLSDRNGRHAVIVGAAGCHIYRSAGKFHICFFWE